MTLHFIEVACARTRVGLPDISSHLIVFNGIHFLYNNTYIKLTTDILRRGQRAGAVLQLEYILVETRLRRAAHRALEHHTSS